MSVNTAKQFLEQAERSGLITPETANGVAALCSGEGAATIDVVVEHLVARKFLTAYQAEQVRTGQGAACSIASRYQVLEKLGEGGMGAVFKARDTQLDRVVAVKILPAGRLNDTDAVARFQREAKALARLSHPHIIQAFDSGNDDGRHFLVMEFVDGIGLDKVLRQYGALAPTLAAELIHQAALGLHHAHEKGLIHRDVKPANLLASGLTAPTSNNKHETVDFTPSWQPMLSSRPTVKLLDLGLARFLQDQVGDTQLTQEGTGMGTPDYMAPEQFRDAVHADARTDIYGLGCTLYHLLAGEVPFPGTSFSEKANAHAKKPAIPIEERCPEVPAGLAFVVQKMMAKHPAERYQSAAEVAEALTPYLSGRSHSLIRLRETGRWPPGQPTMLAPTRARRALRWSGYAAGVTGFAALLVLAWPALFPSKPPDAPANDNPPPMVQPEKKSPQEPIKPKVVTIANGLTVAQDGTGQYTTIQAALNEVKPGQTIRVLDAAAYRESLVINRPSQHARITLEAVNGATLLFPKGQLGLFISEVPHVTVRGFRCRHEAELLYMIGVGGDCPGVHLAGLDLKTNDWKTGAVTLEMIEPGRAVGVVENCTIQGGSAGLRVSGHINFTNPSPCGSLVLRNNTIIDASQAIVLTGCVRQVHVVGNRIGFTLLSAIQLENLLAGAGDILIANNTTLDCKVALRVWENGKKTDLPKTVRITNNLFLGSNDADLIFLDSGGSPSTVAGPGPGDALIKTWQWSHNVRETKRPQGNDVNSKSWIPIAPADSSVEKLNDINRTPGAPGFLQPPKGHMLADKGAGGDLPGYIGAVPPDGAAWDWQWTWDALAQKLLTVSKDVKAGGRFRSINDALDRVQPGMTIRVLDKETYAEPIVLSSGHAGITLEAGAGAVLSAEQATGSAIAVKDVPNLTVRGFRLRADGPKQTLVHVKGIAPALLLERLTFEPGSANDYDAIYIHAIAAKNANSPVMVRECTLHKPQVGIGVHGWDYSGNYRPCADVVLRENLILDPTLFGIMLKGHLERVHVVGNRIGKCARLGAIQIEDLAPESRDLLLANNTVCDAPHAFRLWDARIKGTNVRIVNNLFLGCTNPDMVYFDSGGDPFKVKGPGDGPALHKSWTMSHNWREARTPTGPGLLEKSWIPPGPTDVLKDRIAVRSRQPSSPDYLTIEADSPLANAGIGGDLPSYVGAAPPMGAKPWDWSKTWKASYQGDKSK